MPYLNKPKRHYTNKYKKHDKQGDIQKIYNTSKWQRLRNAHLMAHPLCENCLANNKVTPATCVHHKHIISAVEDELSMIDTALDPYNCMSLCSDCHTKMHTLARRKNMTYIDYIKI